MHGGNESGAVAAVVAHPVDVEPVGRRRRVDLELDGLAPIDADPRREALDRGRARAADVPLGRGAPRQAVLSLDRVRRR